MSGLLPAQFEALEPFVGFWAVESAAERTQRRTESSAAQRVAFFDAMRPALPDVLAMLDSKPIRAFDEAEERLMKLALSFAHVALAVEIQGEEEPKHARNRVHLQILRAPADG